MTESWTIAKMLNWCTDYFQNKGISSARLDAELLLAHVLGLTRMHLYLNFDRPLAETELATFKDIIKRRARQEPVAYITGRKEFWSREFLVRPGVLIPRPDTEVLVEVTLERLKVKKTDALLGFEMGTGSGAIAVTLLAEMPQLKMSAVENSEIALSVTRENASKHGVAERLTLHPIDFLQEKAGHWPLSEDTRFDFVVSNPPYINELEWPALASTVRDFEPREALYGGHDGLEYYPVLANFAKVTLKPGGFLTVEIGDRQGPAVAEIFRTAGLSEVAIRKDYAGMDRVVSGVRVA